MQIWAFFSPPKKKRHVVFRCEMREKNRRGNYYHSWRTNDDWASTEATHSPIFCALPPHSSIFARHSRESCYTFARIVIRVAQFACCEPLMECRRAQNNLFECKRRCFQAYKYVRRCTGPRQCFVLFLDFFPRAHFSLNAKQQTKLHSLHFHGDKSRCSAMRRVRALNPAARDAWTRGIAVIRRRIQLIMLRKLLQHLNEVGLFSLN